MTEGEPDGGQRLSFAGQSLLISALFAVEAAASFAVDIVVAAAFGLTAQADALLVAWALPLTIGRSVFQSLTKSFMGLFAGNRGGSRDYGPAILAVASLAFPGAALLSVTSAWWLPLTMPGAGAGTRALAVSLARTLSWLVAFLALAETTRAVYYREGRWAVPSLARLAGDVVAIGALWLAGRSDDPALAAWGLVAGAGLEGGLGLLGLHWWVTPRIEWRWPSRPEWREMLNLVGAPMAGQGVRTLAGVVERAVASLLPVGTVAAVSHATRIIHAVERFVLGGFVISAIRSESDGKDFDQRSAFRLVAWVGLWVAVVVVVLGQSLAHAAFARGQFSSANAATLATVLRSYGLTILGLAATRVPFALGYARKRPGVILGYFVTVSLGLIASLVVLVRLGFGLSSFGLSQAVGVWAAFGFLYLALLRPHGDTFWTLVDSRQWLVGAVITLGGTWAVSSTLAALVGRSSLGSWLHLVAGLGASVAFWALSAWVLGLREAIGFVGWAKGKLSR